MKSPLEFSQPHSPVLGSWMQPVPKPSSLPLPFQKKVQPPSLELSSDSVGASQVYASHVP